MKQGTVITVSRQFGSGGREIAQKLADRLNIPYLDNELIQRAAEKSGYSKEIFDQADQKPTGSLLYSMSLFASNGVGFDLPLSDKVFLVQSDVIKEAAEQGSCVIVGRCADYVLRDFPSVISIYIHSNIEKRIKRAVEKYKVDSVKCKDVIAKNDKRRAAYYNFYTGNRWGQAENYDITINSGKLGVEQTVEALIQFLENN